MNTPLLEQAEYIQRTEFSIPLLVREGLFIATITLALAGAIELAVRLIAPQNLHTQYVQGGTAGMADADLGQVNRPGSVAVVAGPEFDVEYRINAQGFRDSTLHNPNTVPGVTRILMLGDSFTFGVGNHYEQIWPAIVERELRASGENVEIVKAGVPGYDTRQEVTYLERLYEKARPDIVVIGFVFHDLFSNTPLGSGMPEAGSAIRTMGSKKSEFHSLVLTRRMLMKNDKLYGHLYRASGRQAWFTMPLTDEAEHQLAVTSELFTGAARFCQQRGCKLVVISIPQLYQVLEQSRSESEKGAELSWVDRELGRVASEQGFVWTPTLPDLASTYGRTGNDLYYRFDGHLNAAGNRIVADAAMRTLAQTIRAGRATDE